MKRGMFNDLRMGVAWCRLQGKQLLLMDGYGYKQGGLLMALFFGMFFLGHHAAIIE